MNKLQALRNLDLPLWREPFIDRGNRRFRKGEKLQDKVLAEKERSYSREGILP